MAVSGKLIAIFFYRYFAICGLIINFVIKERALRRMKGAILFRLVCVTLLWLFFCGWLLYRYNLTGTPINLRTLFPLVASGIIVFVPLYKKYFKRQSGK